jgi:nicotinamide mononucleotide transporter
VLFLRLSEQNRSGMPHGFFKSIADYVGGIGTLEVIGLVFGLLAVIWLIRQNILTWPAGLVYVMASLIIFWKEKLYADFFLHIIYLGLNFYGWYYWKHGKKEAEKILRISTTTLSLSLFLLFLSFAGIFATGYVLERYSDASLPYWDSATTILSFTGMWLTARKKIENWYYWFVVDVLAAGIYYYKGIQLYALLYLIYIGLAIAGYLSWKKAMSKEDSHD